MSNYLVDGADLTSVANAIRTKGGTSAQLAFPQGFVDAVEAIETGGITPTGTKNISISANGTTTEDVTNYANAEITVNVPVGWTTLAIAQNQAPSGRIAIDNAITIAQGAFSRRPIVSLFAPNARLNNTAFAYCPNLISAVFRDITSTEQFRASTSLTSVDFRDGNIGGNEFYGCTALSVIVIRKNSVATLGNVSVFTNTHFASGKAGGTLYVPQALIASYQSATNWSTILGYANNQIKSIESTATDPDAPVDLTTHYIDGTPIPTT